MAKSFLIWFWSGGGGGSHFAVNLARRLALQHGADCVRLSLRADDAASDHARALGLDVRAAAIVSDRNRPLATMADLARGASVLAEHARGVDAVIIPMNFAAAAPLSAMLKQPLVYCAHDPAPHPGDYAPLLQWATQSLLFARATRVVALSDHAAALLRARGVGAKLVTAPLAWVFEPHPMQEARIAGPMRLLFAGRMIAYKGLDILADALDQIAARDDWRLDVAGKGPALTEAAAARLRHPQIETVSHEWLSDEALAGMIAACDVLLAPYSSATQSGIVAQAMAHGKPCVVTPVGALAEQVGGGGWIASAATGDAFAAALAQALGDAEGRAAKARAAHAIARGAWEAYHWNWLARL